MFRMVDLIIKKRNGNELSTDEINFIIENYVNGSIPDYQVSSLMMAIYFNPLSSRETLDFTTAMLKSGDEIDLSPIKGIKVDKHSTGGVGDKTSLVVAPMASALGVKLAKMSGRGLGHSGGTLDKLESIPGFTIELESERFFEQVNKIGLAIIGQSANITPADKKLYALRDVTGTIESEGMIVASIMSKKLASGADHIVLDVKVGKGAFMKDLESAKSLAKAMVKIGKLANRDTVATITNMNQPLGRAVGNSLEVIEAIETLKGNGPEDFTELCLQLTAEILLVTGMTDNIDNALALAEETITSGAALNKLKEMIIAQGGNPDVINDYSLFKEAGEVIELTYQNDEIVYIESIDAEEIGIASVMLGAGRQKKEDDIDHSVGIVLNKKVGDTLQNGDLIATVYANGKNTNEAVKKILDAYVLTNEVVEKPLVILDTIR